MRQLLVWSIAFLVTWVAIVALAAVILRWRLQKANRVSPAVRTPAPIHWMWSPREPARLHRRLRTATRDIHLAPSRRSRDVPSLSVDDLRRELEYQAVELDHHLVAAARHPRAQRRALLWQLQGQVAEVERLSAGNMKRTWVNHGRSRDWFDTEQGAGGEFLEHATQVKNIWIPYGE